MWGNGYDLRMAIYDTTGVLINTTAPIDVCIQADVQENPFVVQSVDETTVFWADNRASAGNGRQVFMQRFDANLAQPLLPENGVLAMQVNGNNISYPRAFVAEDNSFIVAMYTAFDIGGGTSGFRVGRVTNTGTNLWSDTTRFCNGPLGPMAAPTSPGLRWRWWCSGILVQLGEQCDLRCTPGPQRAYG